MREIKVRAPTGTGKDIAQIAFQCGAKHVTIHSVYNAQTQQDDEEIKVKSSSPTAHRFIDVLRRAPLYNQKSFSISSHDIRSILASDHVDEITRPFCVPPAEVYQDLWQGNHVTPSFVVRVLISAMLLAYAMLYSRFVLMIGAMLFTVFSPSLMAIGLGMTLRDESFVRQAIKAFTLANLVSILGAVLVTLCVRAPLMWDDFGAMAGNAFISIAAGIVGAVADADDAGRRQLLAIAAAFPYARFPPWIGICIVRGFPGWQTTVNRLEIFGVNILAMIVSSALTYGFLGFRRWRNP